MIVSTSRRAHVILAIAATALVVLIWLMIGDPSRAGERPWSGLGALAIVGVSLSVLYVRQKALERQVGEYRRAERALRDSEAKFSGILAIAADAIITFDQTQQIVHFNQGAERIFGYPAGEIIGRHLGLLIPPRFRLAHDQHVERFVQAPEGARRMGERREIFGLRADGTEFPAEASISKLVAPDGILLTAVLRDITERKRAEENEHFMGEASRELAHALDFDAAVRAIADLPVPRLADVAVVDLAVPGDALRRVAGTRERQSLTYAVRMLAAAPVTGDSPSPIVDVIRRQRSEIIAVVDEAWLEANEEPAAAAAWRALGARSLLIVPLVAGGESLGALTLIAVDSARSFRPEVIALAEKFAAAAAVALQNAQFYAAVQRANRAREEVLGVVSHDLRNPLGAIAVCARTLEDDPPPDERVRRDLIATIRESAAWSNRLIQDLVDVSSLDQGRLSLRAQPTDPVQLAVRASHMFEVEAANHGISIIQNIPPGLPLVQADGERIIQVLGNLLRNAVKFTPDGGTITLGVRLESGHGVFTVCDTGAGVALEHRESVFDRYWQSSDGSRARGSGLGLSIAKGIVEAHGGRIWLENPAGRGATFAFTVPVAAAPPS